MKSEWSKCTSSVFYLRASCLYARCTRSKSLGGESQSNPSSVWGLFVGGNGGGLIGGRCWGLFPSDDDGPAAKAFANGTASRIATANARAIAAQVILALIIVDNNVGAAWTTGFVFSEGDRFGGKSCVGSPLAASHVSFQWPRPQNDYLVLLQSWDHSTTHSNISAYHNLSHKNFAHCQALLTKFEEMHTVPPLTQMRPQIPFIRINS